MYILIVALNQEVEELNESEKGHLVISGMGKINAMFALSQQFQKYNGTVSGVINLGTAGSDRIAKGSLVEVVKSYQRDTSFFSDPISFNGVTDLPRVSCGSGDQVCVSISSDPWDIVDMELYSVAFFCRKMAIPLVSIKYVADRNERIVYKEWKKQWPPGRTTLSQYWLSNKDRILSQLRLK